MQGVKHKFKGIVFGDSSVDIKYFIFLRWRKLRERSLLYNIGEKRADFEADRISQIFRQSFNFAVPVGVEL